MSIFDRAGQETKKEGKRVAGAGLDQVEKDAQGIVSRFVAWIKRICGIE